MVSSLSSGGGESGNEAIDIALPRAIIIRISCGKPTGSDVSFRLTQLAAAKYPLTASGGWDVPVPQRHPRGHRGPR